MKKETSIQGKKVLDTVPDLTYSIFMATETQQLTYGYAVYAFPSSLDWDDFDPYFKHISKAVGFAEYIGEFPPVSIPKSMTEVYPAEFHKFVTSPRVWKD